MSDDKINNDGNVTRPTIPRDPLNPSEVPGLPTGYEGQPAVDFVLPACGLYQADEALLNLFRKDIGYQTISVWSMNEEVKLDRPQVIWATGERYAVGKKLRPPLDRNKNLILPAISLRRTDVSFTIDDQRRGITQKAGSLIIKRKLSKEYDRDYQNVLNKIGLKHLANVHPMTTRTQGEYSQIEEVIEGGVLYPTVGNNMYEVITLPMPQYYTATYEIVFWTSYMQHMNHLIETTMNTMLPQTLGYKLVTPNGYWFIAYVEEAMTNGSNLEDFSDNKRILKYNFNVKIHGYLLPGSGDTNEVPIRKFIYSPVLKLDVEESPGKIASKSKIGNVVDPNKDGLGLFSLDEDLSRDPSLAQTSYEEEKTLFEINVPNENTGKFQSHYVTQRHGGERKSENVFRANSKQTLESFLQSLRGKPRR